MSLYQVKISEIRASKLSPSKFCLEKQSSLSNAGKKSFYITCAAFWSKMPDPDN